MIELEDLLPAKNWALERAHPGFTGSGYIVDQGGGVALTIRVVVAKAGHWRVALRNRHDHPDSTLENDCWLSVDGSPRVKTFSSTGGAWNWQTRLEVKKHTFAEPLYDFDAGVHTIVVSGRSAGFRIDRLHLFRDGMIGADDAGRPTTPYLPALPTQGDRRLLTLWGRGELGKALLTARTAEDTAAIAMLETCADTRHKALVEAYVTSPEFAADTLARWALLWRGSDIGDSLANEAAAWAKDPAYRDARTARMALDSLRPAVARLLERQASGSTIPPTQLAETLKALARIAERWPQCPAAAAATALAAQLLLPSPP